MLIRRNSRQLETPGFRAGPAEKRKWKIRKNDCTCTIAKQLSADVPFTAMGTAGHKRKTIKTHEKKSV